MCLYCLQAARNDCDTADHASPSKDNDQAQSGLLETAAAVDKTDPSGDVHIKREDAKLLFGNGRLDRWLSKRRAFNQPPKLKTFCLLYTSDAADE